MLPPDLQRKHTTGHQGAALSSATFTFRIPDNMVGRLSSGEMRSWLTQFRRNPHPLPPDPGSGYERISLTLPRGLVQTAAFDLRCTESEALRRLAHEHLGPPQGAKRPSEPFFRPTSIPEAGNPLWRPVATRTAVVGGRSREEALGKAGAQLVASVITLALILLVSYFISKSKKQV